MDAVQLVNWGFQALATGAVIYGVKEMGRLRESIESLNSKMATIIERTDNHGKQIERHDLRIRELETKEI